MGGRSEAYFPQESIPLNREEQAEDEDLDALLYPPHRRRDRSWIFTTLLVLSVATNIVLAACLLYEGSFYGKGKLPVTKYAGLARDVQVAFNSSSSFGTGNMNETDRSILWESLDTSAGEISLDNGWAAARGLPDTTPFFWDPTRGIYLLNAHHSLHCMLTTHVWRPQRKVRRWVTLAHYGIAQLDSYLHIVHCMDHLLQNILCEADDTPMYTSPERNATTGMGQPRMCRSWDKLSAWADTQSACFGYINETQGVQAVIQRFRYCPPDSALLEPMRSHFGYQGDWFASRPADIETMPHYWEDFPPLVQ